MLLFISIIIFAIIHVFACTKNDNDIYYGTFLTDEAEDPASMPVFWICKWVDYTDKYGLGYQLCDNSIGVLFNDFSKLLLGADGE